MRRLPETDLARIAGMPQMLWRSALDGFDLKRVFVTYHPVRKHMPDIVNEQSPLLPSQPPTPWPQLEKLVGTSSRSDEIRKVNLAVAKSLYYWTTTNGITARRYAIEPLKLAMGLSVAFWSSTVLVIDGRPVVPFLEPRRYQGLNADGRRIALSFMMERLRDDPDLGDAKPAIVQFRNSDLREVVVYTADEIELLSAAQLEDTVAAIYALWAEIEAQRRDAS